MSVPRRYQMTGSTAREIAASIETGIRQGHLHPGDGLPTVRAAAALLGVSPVTVASAYRALQGRGFVSADGRRGTRVSQAPALTLRHSAPLPEGVRDLAQGNPDLTLLPALDDALRGVDPAQSLYGEEANLPELLEVARTSLGSDNVDTTSLAVVGGAADGMERVLQAHLRPGDKVAIEDPSFTRVIDLVGAMGLVPVPVAMDELGMAEGALARALEQRVEAVIVTPRAQNPTGAALDATRTSELRGVLDGHAGVLVIEDDHAGPVAGTEAFTLCAGRERWATVRSVSKFLGPDLRLAILAGDPVTVARVNGRQRIGTGWVSHVLQQIVAHLWSKPDTALLFERAAGEYAARRAALIDALDGHGIAAVGRSGLNVWVPLDEEAETTQALMHADWAVAPGERYRLETPPAIRVTAAALIEDEAERFAADLARILAPQARTYLT
ncbi:MAG: aminotransferase class I/II-fold pyridoxal phosphate-dependent enzyme [Actinomycetota bacterium]